MNKKNIYIGWDIGGAHTKYTTSKEKSFSFNSKIIPLKIWNNLDHLEKIINDVHNKYLKSYNIINAISMSAEMCDIFDNRKVGVRKILSLFDKKLFKNYIYSSKYGIIENSKKLNHQTVASMNWHIIADYLRSIRKNLIAIDLGSTTTDIILIRNHKCINKRVDDLSGLISSELLYTGILRTPIFSIIKRIRISDKYYHLIPEYYATMADVYRLLDIITLKEDYSDTADGRSKSKSDSLARVSRSLGFDYKPKNKKLIISICEKIMSEHLDQISYNIEDHVNKNYKHTKSLEFVGLGVGKSIIKKICMRNKWFYKDIGNLIDIRYISNLENVSTTMPSFLLSLLVKGINEKTK